MTASLPAGLARHQDDASLPADPLVLTKKALSTQYKDPRPINLISKVADLLGSSGVDSKRELSSATESDHTAGICKKLYLPVSNSISDV